MSPDIYARAFSPDGTGVLDGFISAKRNPYSAALSFDTTEKRVKLVFPNDRGSRESSPCPRNHEPERTSKQNDDILL
jgi:hypothetical protein